jgi:hypothetical protein
MDTWTITAVDPAELAEGSAERGTLQTYHGERGEALARGCSAIAAGWIDVNVEGTFQTYAWTDPAASA